MRGRCGYTLPLASPEAAVAVVGSKAARLSELIRQGIRVPPGYVVTTGAFAAFVEANGLGKAIEQFRVELGNGGPDSWREAAARLCTRVENGAMPEAVAHAIILGYRSFGDAPAQVAVRSSAVAEDLPGASFAGQMKTFLGVAGERELIDSCVRSFASLWAPAAVAYRLDRKLDPTPLEYALIVQKMVRSQLAGFLFTANPVNGDRDEIVINAATGLGDTIVDGSVTPETIILKRAEPRPHTPTAMSDRSALTEEQVGELVRTGAEIEAHFGAPQDIEWSFAEDSLWILQSRPITGLSEADDKSAFLKLSPAPPGDDCWPALGEGERHDDDLWTRSNVGELWPDPVSPLVWSMLPEIIGSAARFTLNGVRPDAIAQTRWAARYYGRVYYNEGALTRVLHDELGLPISIVDRPRGNQSERAMADGQARVGRLLLRLPLLTRLSLRQWSVAGKLRAILPRAEEWTEASESFDMRAASDGELWDGVLLWLERLKLLFKLQGQMSGLSFVTVGLLERLVGRWLGRNDLVNDLVTGIEGLEAAEIGYDLAAISNSVSELGLAEWLIACQPDEALARVREDPFAAPVNERLEAFLRRHGHRCPNETEWLFPRWADTPERVLELAAAYLRSGTNVAASRESAELSRKNRRAAITLIESQLGFMRRLLFRRLLSKAQNAVRLCQVSKDYAMRACHQARRISLSLGQRWADQGSLESAEDVFFLTLPDMQVVNEAGGPALTGFDLKSLVRGRRLAFDWWHSRPAPAVIDADGWPVREEASPAVSTDALQGIAVSAGVVRGRARIVHNPADALASQAGDIVVIRSMDAGWTAVFPLITGLVTEIGGQLSHSAILAREYGLPAVFNVSNATSRIKDRQQITIDGSRGLVYLESEENS